MKAEAMLVEPKLKLPEPPPPRGNYMAAVQHDSLLFISGQFPLINGQLAYRGKLGRDLDAADGYQAARLCAINALAQVQKILLSLDVVAGIARLEGYLQTVAGFQEHAKVLDGASDLFHQVLGERAAHTRAVFGVGSLPKSWSRLKSRVGDAGSGSGSRTRLGTKSMRSFDGKLVERSIWRGIIRARIRLEESIT